MRKLLTVMLVGLCVFILVGCGDKGSASKEKVPQKTITIGVMPDVESIPFVIAEKNGYFTKAGVNVKIEHFTSAKDRDSALQSGKLDGVITDVLAVVFANEGGIDLKMIAKSEGNILLMAGKDSGIKTVNDLKGKSVGLSTNTIMEYTVDQMLANAGMQASDIKKIAIPPLPTRLEMLQGGKIDAAILPEPLAGLAIKGGAVTLSTTDELKNKAGAIAFTGKCLKENPNEIKAIVAAYNQAADDLQKQPPVNYIDYIIQEQGFPPAIKDSLTLPKYQHASAPDTKIVANVVEWMLDKQLIKNSFAYKDLTAEGF
ncbi:MAG TPA: MetQ/NlpA family ABC transporter substrate-binding protein [Syntrophomonas sp.]|nr:MetQ/NlpA family ABC transporter substrate-binding protein [Syntrophomonas sp.]